MTMSIIDQDYGGDITIINPPRLWSPAKILSQLSLDEMEDLIATGEAMTWPKVEMIRTQTVISKTLTHCAGTEF
jgi:NTE family protein